jgi:hypothetical protein
MPGSKVQYVSIRTCHRRKPNRHILVETILGFVVLFTISRIPFAGWLVKYAAVLVGFGGVLSATTSDGELSSD